MSSIRTPLVAEAACIPTGFALSYQAKHSSLSGVVNAPVPIMWDVRKG